MNVLTYCARGAVTDILFHLFWDSQIVCLFIQLSKVKLPDPFSAKVHKVRGLAIFRNLEPEG
jgi:hypothetical protein